MPGEEVMKEFHAGRLHSGSKHGPLVRKRSQAVAIQLDELRREGKIPKRKSSRMAEAMRRNRHTHTSHG